LTFTILITCVGGDLGPQLVHQLKENSRHKTKVIGVDADLNATGKFFCDAFSVVPFGNSPDYVASINELIRLHKVDLVIPTSDEEAISLSSSREKIEINGCKLACVDSATIEILSDKAKTYQFLKDKGVHVPVTKVIKDFDTLKTIVEEMHKDFGAVVIKPSIARGGRGVYIISSVFQGVKHFDDKREIHCDLETFNNQLFINLKDDFPLIVMEKLNEPVIDIDLLAWKGIAKRIVSRKRVNSAVPNDGHIIIQDKSLNELANKLIEILQLSWLYDCDVMFDSQGSPCVLELNPRQSGSISVSIAAGIPMLDDLISLAKGEPIEQIRLPVNKRVIPYKSLQLIK
jgi:carbamoylphosphate synthase large subunit